MILVAFSLYIKYPETVICNLSVSVKALNNIPSNLLIIKKLKIIVPKKPLESKLIHTKISSIYRSFSSGDIVINVEIPDMESDFFSEISKSKEITIPAEIVLSEKTLFSRIFSKIKEIA